VIAGWSYSEGQTLSNKLKYYGFPFNTVDQIQVVNPAMLIVATAYFVRSQCGRVGVLSFRGTEPVNAINWLTDADVTQRAVNGGKVHAGFYANLQSLWDEVCEHIGEATTPRGVTTGDGSKCRLPMQVLYVTGHSLGAAMAALAAARIFADDGPISREIPLLDGRPLPRSLHRSEPRWARRRLTTSARRCAEAVAPAGEPAGQSASH
ncbi:MAG: hypothetical protein H5U40_19230, partial [Polyangiaceae bacterium]|nr:hypothetical protein [Polyangiaceae bacterium]